MQTNYFKAAFIWLFIFSLIINCFHSLNISAEVLLKGSATRTVSRGTPLSLKIVSLPSNGYSSLDQWDLNGQFIPPNLGDPITSILTKEIRVEQDLVLPEGTVFYGKVSSVQAPKSFGRDGSLEVSFHSLKTPKGKYLKFEDATQTLKQESNSKLQNFAYGVARTGSYAAGGIVTGALAGVYTSGLALTAMSPEYIIGTGAGIGFLAGIIISIVKKGASGRLMPGDEVQINLSSDVILPVTEDIKKRENTNYVSNQISLSVLSKKLVDDGFGKNALILDVELQNHSARALSLNQIFLLGPQKKLILPGGSYAFSSDEDFENDLTITGDRIKPGQKTTGKLTYAINFPGFEHRILVKDRMSQATLANVSVGYPVNYFEETRGNKLQNKIFGRNSAPWK